MAAVLRVELRPDDLESPVLTVILNRSVELISHWRPVAPFDNCIIFVNSAYSGRLKDFFCGKCFAAIDINNIFMVSDPINGHPRARMTEA